MEAHKTIIKQKKNQNYNLREFNTHIERENKACEQKVKEHKEYLKMLDEEESCKSETIPTVLVKTYVKDVIRIDKPIRIAPIHLIM
jgi:hypothetical protein